MNRYVRCVRESGGLGDLVRCLAVAQGLRKKYPEHRVHFYGARYLQNLIAPRSDAFDLYVPCSFGVRNREQPLDETKFSHLNRGIIYEDSVDMWCWAYLHEPSTKGVCAQDRIELWCMHGGVEPSRPKLNLLESDLVWKNRTIEKANGKKIIGCQVGATCRSREWPYEHWNELFRRLKHDYHIILFDVCYRWKEISVDGIELSIDRPWDETLGKLAACDLVITPDSGFYHLSGAIRRPTVGLFGCTSGIIISRPWRWEVETHDYLQLTHDELDKSQLYPECQPICYMRWERGWRGDRYRRDGEYCSVLKQLEPARVEKYVREKLR